MQRFLVITGLSGSGKSLAADCLEDLGYYCVDNLPVQLVRPFYDLLVKRIGLEGEDLPDQMDRAAWPTLKDRMADVFKSKTRAEWCDVLEGTDVCFAPVLDLDEAPEHPHLKERGTFMEIADIIQAAPAPRFSRTPPQVSGPPPFPGQHTDEALGEWGFTDEEIVELREFEAIK